MKNFKFLIIAIVFFAAGFLLGQSFKTPVLNFAPNQQGEQEINKTAVYVLKFGENDVVEYQDVALGQNETALSLLTKIAEQNGLALETKDYGAMGILVTRIGNKTNGQENKYWQYYVNDAKPQVGADRYVLSGGERVEWRFEEFVSE